MSRRQHRALMRRGALEYARAYLGKERLPREAQEIARAYADTIDTWAMLPGLGRHLARYRTPRSDGA